MCWLWTRRATFSPGARMTRGSWETVRKRIRKGLASSADSERASAKSMQGTTCHLRLTKKGRSTFGEKTRTTSWTPETLGRRLMNPLVFCCHTTSKIAETCRSRLATSVESPCTSPSGLSKAWRARLSRSWTRWGLRSTNCRTWWGSSKGKCSHMGRKTKMTWTSPKTRELKMIKLSWTLTKYLRTMSRT